MELFARFVERTFNYVNYYNTVLRKAAAANPMQESRASILSALMIRSERDYPNAVLKICAEPEAVCPVVQTINLQTGVNELKNIALLLNPSYLISLSERVAVTVTFSVEAEGKTLLSKADGIWAVPMDTCNFSGKPGMIVPFVMPNDPYVSYLLSKVPEKLQQDEEYRKMCLSAPEKEYVAWLSGQGKLCDADPSMTGYSGSPKLVEKVVEKIFASVLEENISYHTVPRSFTNQGQRIRLPWKIRKYKQANCADMTLLFCSLLEGAGYNPFMILVPGHVFAGVFLQNMCFNAEEIGMANALPVLRTGLEQGNILLFECTIGCQGPQKPTAAEERSTFRSAVQCSAGLIEREKIERLIDVRFCRSKEYLPLPSIDPEAVPEGGSAPQPTSTPDSEPQPSSVPEPTPSPKPDPTPVPELKPIPKPVPPRVGDSAKQRYQALCRSVLDLSASNPLLSIQYARGGSLPLCFGSVNAVMKLLAAPYPVTAGETDCSSYEDAPAETSKIHAALRKQEDVNRVLDKLARKNDVILSETGRSSLALGLGMLRWADDKGKAHDAPIAVIPVSMERGIHGFLISATGKPRINDALRLRLAGYLELPEELSDLKAFRDNLNEGFRFFPHAAVLGCFRFASYEVWKELCQEETARHPAVRSMCERQLMFRTASAEALSAGNAQYSGPMPLALDDAQRAAVNLMTSGAAVTVVSGPPGTGKTHAQAAAIAEAVYTGKRVLVVGAKQKSMDVLANRAMEIGINILRLPDHERADSVRRTINEILERGTPSSPAGFDAARNKLEMLQTSEDEIFRAMVRRRPCGKTLLELLEVSFMDNRPVSRNRLPQLRDISEAKRLEQQLSVLKTMDFMAEELRPETHPLRGIVERSLTPEQRLVKKQELAGKVRDLVELELSAAKLSRALYNDPPRCAREYQILFELAQYAKSAGEILRGRPCPELSDLRNAADAIAEQAKKARQLRVELTTVYGPRYLHLDPKKLLAELSAQSLFLYRSSVKNSAMNTITAYANRQLNISQIKADLHKLEEYQKREDILHKQMTAAGRVFGTAGETYAAVSASIEKLGNALEEMSLRLDKDQLQIVLADQNTVKEFLAAWAACGSVFENAEKDDRDHLPNAIVKAREALASMDALSEWSSFCKVLEQARALHLEDQVRRCLNGEREIAAQYWKDACTVLAMHYIKSEPCLAAFSALQMRDLQDRLANQRSVFRKVSAQKLRAVPIPDMTQSSQENGQATALRSWLLAKNGSVREVFETSAELILKICPVVFSAPETVASCLPNRELFDLVIFDEASRISPGLAVPAILRSKSTICCGDPKQMPPFTEFQLKQEARHWNTALPASILEAMLGLNAPSATLTTSYRPLSEDLLYFSSQKYYAGKLQTFPAPQNEDHLRLVPVDGHFQHSKRRVNPEEADAILQELKRRCANADDRHDTIGIITMNVQQQELIERKLAEARAVDSLFDSFLRSRLSWIKNLETVQGDEADAVLFSIAFSETQTGKLPLNFGPLNHAEEGKRRLNVAISRAKKDCLVYCSFDPERIPKESSGALPDLREFLLYAKSHTTNHLTEFADGDSQIRKALKDGLEEAGWLVSENVGISAGRRIDMAIKRKKDGPYILGILIDTPEDSFTQQLRQRSWRLARVYSLSFYESPKSVLDYLLREAAFSDKEADALSNPA